MSVPLDGTRRPRPGAVLRVHCPRKIIGDFKKAAKTAYPNELYAVLFGTIDEDAVQISDVWYPPASDQSKASTDYVLHRKPWLDEAMAIADSAGLVIVADLHSHPDARSREPSEADWDGSPDGWLQGICPVWRTDKRRKRASVRFWPSARPVRLRLL